MDIRAIFLGLVSLWILGWGANATAEALPPELAPWQDWVLHEHPEHSCPFVYNSAERRCIWPSQLQLDAEQEGGQFELLVDVFAPQWVPLPGGTGYWPEQVRNQNQPVPVVNRKGVPQVFLPPGQHRLQGQWRWTQLPRSLPVPDNMGLLKLNLNGESVATPSFARPGQLWLAVQPREPDAERRDSLDIQVFRRVQDSNPLQVTTWVRLVVSGAERELLTGPVLLPGFTPRALQSDLPARIEPDGQLRVQLQPGRWDIQVTAHSPAAPLAQLNYRAGAQPWPNQEVWVFAAEPELRRVQIEQVPSIDPSQTQLPDRWQSLPAYLMTPETNFVLNEIQRGEPNPPANRLQVNKDLWLDFDGRAFTARDQINGRFTRGDRLEAQPPYDLGRVTLGEQLLPITRLTPEASAGVAVRQVHLALEAVSRVAKQAQLPVSGWQVAVDEVHTQLHLPPGWSLLHASGADRVQGSWLAAWTLWDIFLVVVIAVGIGRIGHPWLGLLALGTLVLTLHRPGAPVWLWLNLAVALALLPHAQKKLLHWGQAYAGISFVLLLIIYLPFAVSQARQLIYPQLEQTAETVPAYYDYSADAVRGEIKLAAEPESAPMLIRSRELAVSADRVSPQLPTRPEPQRYDPDQQIQAGPSLPTWQWRSAQLHWSGPVTAGETTRIWLLGPWISRLGLLLSLLLPILLAALLLRRAGGHFPRPSPNTWRSLMPSMLIAAMISLPTEPVSAQVLVDKDLLQELQQRLLAPPRCLPECVGLEAVHIELANDQLQVQLRLHTTEALALPLPAQLDQWWPASVRVNGQSAALLHSRDGQLFIYLPEGRHQVQVTGSTQGLEQVQLPFRLPLHNVTHNLRGWQISGLPGAQQVSQNLQLVREQDTTARGPSTRLQADALPAYVTVSRRIQLGLEWTVTTQVQRVAPQQGAIQLAVTLLPGEAPDSGQRNPDGTMDVRLGAGQNQVSWRSILPQSEVLTLTAPEQKPWSELWSLQASELWHTEISGIPTLAREGANLNPVWAPWPGEQVQIEAHRPPAISGETQSIDAVVVEQNVGRRAQDLTLNLRIRATQGGHYHLALPPSAQLQSVRSNGQDVPASQTPQGVQIPLNPGEQQIEVRWQEERSITPQVITPQLDLRLPAANIEWRVVLPKDRWILAVNGPPLGPAILFWGVLLVVLVLALLLGRSGLTPVKAYEWVLLSLGIATLNVYILALIAVWFVALQLRGRSSVAPQNQRFNLVQLLLGILSLLTILALLTSISMSLLSQPDMMVVGNGSHAGLLQWYQDRSHGELPQAWVLSLPILAYRLAMLAWSLWLALAIMRWLPWAWRQVNAGGLWYFEPAAKTPSPGTPPSKNE